MAWNFVQPFLFKAKEYKLWYNEDLTGGAYQEDNHGRACYTMTLNPSESGMCSARAPLQYTNVCTSAKGNNHGVITLPENTCVTEITLHHISGWFSCTGHASHRSNFGCFRSWVDLVWTNANHEPVMPLPGQIEGVRVSSRTPIWWHLCPKGQSCKVVQNARTVNMKVKNDPLKLSGVLHLWHAVDHHSLKSYEIERNREGTACYEVSVHRAVSC
jgi:hypothetical protein